MGAIFFLSIVPNFDLQLPNTLEGTVENVPIICLLSLIV